MPRKTQSTQKAPMNPLLKNQIIGGTCACLIVVFACVRIFVLGATPDGIFNNLMSITGTVLSLVVLTSAVRIMLAAKKVKSFKEVLNDELQAIDKQYGALIEPHDEIAGDGVDGMVYLIADNVDAVFTPTRTQWDNLKYMEKFSFSENFSETRTIYYYLNYVNMAARAARLGDSLEMTARLLARDTAVAIQRSFSDIVTAHALEITQEEGRAVVTILVNSTETPQDAERIAELIDYLLFLHFVAT
ncbi:MAG: hypothetical protein FWD43_02605 [Coriobacteriia bacterium]|nr:hypothetical protein [Coriobacteriia bacterium]